MNLSITLPILVYLFSAVALRVIINKLKKECPERFRQFEEEHNWFINVDTVLNLLCLLPLLNTAFLIYGTFDVLFGKD